MSIPHEMLSSLSQFFSLEKLSKIYTIATSLVFSVFANIHGNFLSSSKLICYFFSFEWKLIEILARNCNYTSNFGDSNNFFRSMNSFSLMKFF